jgi:quercetin dioxygenase-like cupin family protein
MTIKVFDYRTDIANVVIHPELRGRFMKMDPAPAGRMHSHDLGGEIFVVLEGQCEFLVEEDRATCGPGQLIYVEPTRKHTLHAVGDGPCVVYLSVTPHVDPTHTVYDENYQELPPQYRGVGVDTAGVGIADLSERYLQSARKLAELAQANVRIAEAQVESVNLGDKADQQPACKAAMDELWYGLRSVLREVSTAEQAWNVLAPRAMATE